MVASEAHFVSFNRGRYAVRHAGVLVQKAFEKPSEAQAWARYNYRGTNWTVEQLWPEAVKSRKVGRPALT